jgi:chemotaxis signal transduction protein
VLTDAHTLASDPYVVIRLAGNFYGVSARSVRSMTEMPPVISIPATPAHVRGAVNLRGSILGLTDLRVRLGIQSTETERTELLEMLEARERDHINWLAELERSVIENREFGLQLNPRLCAFGKWYYSYTPPDQWVASILREFEAPHDTIHGLATLVKELQAQGRIDEARQRLDDTKSGELAMMLHLFGQLRRQIAQSLRETCVVLESGSTAAAFAVDCVESIEHFVHQSFEEFDAGGGDVDLAIRCLARRVKDDAVVIILDAARLIGTAQTSA